jgi:hypothetical protein
MANLATAAAESGFPSQTFTLKSSELGGRFTNKHYYTGMGLPGENQQVSAVT